MITFSHRLKIYIKNMYSVHVQSNKRIHTGTFESSFKFFQGFGVFFRTIPFFLKRFKVSQSKGSVPFSNCTHDLTGQQYTLAVECLRSVLH